MTVLNWLLAQFQSLGVELMIGTFLVVGAIEKIIPAIRVPNRHYVFNVSYSIINTLLSALIAPMIALATSTITRHFSHGLIDLHAIGAGGAVVAMLVSTLVFDFFYYWLHRTQHTSAVLWQEHLLHHSDQFVNVTTSGRTHIIEQFLFPAFITIPTTILFTLPSVTITAVALLPTIWGYVVHANIKLSFGRAWWLLASPQYHRVHHSIEARHFNRNYAVWFPMWDILFGTVYKPDAGEYPATGVEGVEVKTIAEAYLLPFRQWYGMLTNVARKHATQAVSHSGRKS